MYLCRIILKAGLILYLLIFISVQPTEGEKIANNALSLLGTDFASGEKAQCAYFVRYIYYISGCEIGVTSNPSDKQLPIHEGFANSFAGDDIGIRIDDVKDLEPGDIILFQNTYGDWPEGTITHTGIYTGNGFFVHRPTFKEPVKKTFLPGYGRFKEGRRIVYNYKK